MMIVKLNGGNYGIVLNDEFKTLVDSLDKVGIDTKPEIEAWFNNLDAGTQEHVNELVTNQMHDLYGNLDLNHLWDLFLGFFS